MKPVVVLLAVLSATCGPVYAAQAIEPPPAWAYPMTPPGIPQAPDDGVPRRVPDSDVRYTLTQIRDRFVSPVWHPKDHPAQPEVVARGRKPDVFACGFCHRADGPGGPENASVAGLPYAYFVQQVQDYRNGSRTTAVRNRNTELMISAVKAMNDQEIEAAARYFASIKPRSTVTVIETQTVPPTFVTSWHYAVTYGPDEPIGRRIIEVPIDLDRFAYRDTHARFVAYVPVGSVGAGRELAATGGAGKTQACASCHGADLRGVGAIPGIVGRFASYTMRQLYEFKSGARNGKESAPMKAVVEKLSVEDMMVLSAYLASVAP